MDVSTDTDVEAQIEQEDDFPVDNILLILEVQGKNESLTPERKEWYDLSHSLSLSL